ncbi:facilitated trehalose transporter Tret1-2 homolog [Musca vetustissima]|uniref:facilitated trehalose transporter Tret1-2 homolog n=1 Tax=Musca vetustissima TaxID=27455 RepID=UPI002AB7DEFD|nr:facilitated trehalose transporter Tret1-2 homolog [Musca vetustissima]
MATKEREDEYSKLAPTKFNYQIVPATNGSNHNNNNSIETTDIYRQKQCDNEHDHKTIKRGIYHQIIATCAVLLLSAACGMPIGYSAVLLPQLTIGGSATTNSTPEIIIDIEMGSWIASVHSLATPVGSFLSGPMADYIGRRSTLLVSVIPLFIGWSVLALSQSYPMLIIGRLFCGFATGILGGPAQVYIAETAEPNLRGLLIGAPFVSYSLGILIVYALGSALHWRAVAWCGNVLPALAALAIFFIPESPAWLLRHKKLEKARKALKFLRGNEIMAQKEMNVMSERLDKEKATTKTNENIFQLCCQRVAIKPLVIVILFSFLQIASGTFIVVFYAIDIISEFGAGFDPKSAAIWTAVIRMCCTVIFCIILLFIRRRLILILSGIGSGLSCLVLAGYMFAREGQPKNGTDLIVAGVCLMAYIAFNTSLMVMPGIMIGELFPAKIRGRTAGGVFAAMNVALFGFTKMFPMINANISMKGVFIIFGVASILVSIFMYLFQPETKGRTLEQIEDYFNENNWLWFKRDKTYKMVPTKEQEEINKA